MSDELTLWHGDSASAITYRGKTLEYARRIHKYESESDYKAIKTELLTYGGTAAQRVFDSLRRC